MGSQSNFGDDVKIILHLETGNEEKSYRIKKQCATIGRSAACDVCIPNNKFLSKHHVTLHINQSKREVKIDVLSSNGILLNDKVYSKSKDVEWSANSSLYLTHQPDQDKQNVIIKYSFPPSNDDEDTDNTLEYEADHDDTEILEPASKVPRLCSDEIAVAKLEQPSTSKQDSKGIEENLICAICQDIFHDCVSCLPCMHSFCGGCLSGWKEKSSQCPTCRIEVESIRKNHTLANLSLAYIKMKPDLKRSQSELNELDQKNTLKEDLIKVSARGWISSSDESDDESNDEINDDIDDIDISGQSLPFLTACRECPGNAGNSSRSSTGNTCPVNASHILCSCCTKLIPSTSDNSNKRCTLCLMFYCHLYWGCTKPTCRGCLNRFKDLEFNENTLDSILLNNSYESEIFKNYLLQRNVSFSDLKNECMTKLQDRNFQGLSPHVNVKPDDIVCYRCGLHQLRHLAYQYRASIPSNDLPSDITNRQNCHWGNNCRTQCHSPRHARRFNHICDQTRF